MLRARLATALLGAVAVTATTVPAAHALDPGYGPPVPPPTITGVSVNGGKPIVVGAVNPTTVHNTVTATDTTPYYKPYAVSRGVVYLFRGASYDASTDYIDPTGNGSCAKTGPHRFACTTTMKVYGLFLRDSEAGTWKVDADAYSALSSESVTTLHPYPTVKVVRRAELKTNASPEPARAGSTLTVTGALTRVSWDDANYHPYTHQAVELEFRAKGSASYTKVRKVTSDAHGLLRTTATAKRDGYWRFVFAGSSTTGAVTSKSDYVEVR
jgi:hypothetical protein